MPRFELFASAALLLALALAPPARADVTPPPRASITLELTVEGQQTLPYLRFFVTNCREPIDTSVLDPTEPLVCNPAQGPVRIFGFRAGDLPELFALVQRDAGREESAAFLAAKAKTCGSVLDEDLIFPAESGVTLVAARYALEPGPKGGCKLRRLSATKKTRAELQKAPPTGSAAPASSAGPTPTAAPAPSASALGAPAASGGCGCTASSADPTPSALVAAAFGLAWLRRRRRAHPRPPGRARP